MRDYYVHFSFYSEEYGNFEDVRYSVQAETPFEAREKAWPLCDQDEEMPLRSNIKQFAVTWEPNLLDAGDYFYSHAAELKRCMGSLLNVTIPNERIAGGEHRQQLEIERCSTLTALYTLDTVAKDLYADKGMVPPSIYEELHYAEVLCGKLDWEKANALWERTEKAKKWDYGAIYSMRDLFKDGYTFLAGDTEFFNKHFGRNGVYPFQNNLDERDYNYISRWMNQCNITSLGRLPIYQEKDIIQNSASHMDYYWHTLLLNGEMLNEEYQTPENQLWQAVDPLEHSEDVKDGMLLVENPITGQRMICSKEAFLGVLRPDILARLDIEVLKKEYSAVQGKNTSDNGIDYNFDEDEDVLEQ